MQQGLARMDAYVTLNKALAERGLYIKSSNYYEDYEVLTRDETKKRISDYYHTSATQQRAGACLHRNIAAYNSKWRKLGKRQLSKLIAKL